MPSSASAMFPDNPGRFQSSHPCNLQRATHRPPRKNKQKQINNIHFQFDGILTVLVRRPCASSKHRLDKGGKPKVDASQMSPRCFPDASLMLPDASQMPPRSQMPRDASQMPPRCFPDSRCPDATQMLPRCLPDASLMFPRCLPDDSQIPNAPEMSPTTSKVPPDGSSASSSPKWLPNASQKNSVWGLALVSFTKV